MIEETGGLVEPNLNALHFITPAIGWVVGEFGLALQTKDGGQHWFPVEHKIDRDLFGVSVEDQNTLVVGDRTFLTSKDGGGHLDRR